MTTEPRAVRTHKRRAGVAALLSILAPGVGHIYAGRPRRGILIFVLTMLVAVVVYVLSRFEPSLGVLRSMVAVVFLGVGLYLFAIVDSIRVARGASDPFQSTSFQRPMIYLVLCLVSIGWCYASTDWVRDHVMEAFVVPSGSMKPAIQPGDRVLVDKSAYNFARGDLVVFGVNDPTPRNFIKRIHGLSGDVFQGAPVPDGMMWVEGDNRNASKDSRKFGPVPLKSIVGRVIYRFWSKAGLSLGVFKHRVPEPAASTNSESR